MIVNVIDSYNDIAIDHDSDSNNRKNMTLHTIVTVIVIITFINSDNKS